MWPFRKRQPAELAAALAMFETIASSLDSRDLCAPLAIAIAAQEFKDGARKDPQGYMNVLRECGGNIENFVWMSISRTAYQRIGTGEFHMWRGVLQPLGPGPALVNLYFLALNHLCASGVITKEQVQMGTRNIRAAIADVG